MVSLVNSRTNVTVIGWHLWEIDFRFAPGLPPGCGRGDLPSRCQDEVVGEAETAPKLMHLCRDSLAQGAGCRVEGAGRCRVEGAGMRVQG